MERRGPENAPNKVGSSLKGDGFLLVTWGLGSYLLMCVRTAQRQSMWRSFVASAGFVIWKLGCLWTGRNQNWQDRHIYPPIWGDLNPSDILTKGVVPDDLERHLRAIHLYVHLVVRVSSVARLWWSKLLEGFSRLRQCGLAAECLITLQCLDKVGARHQEQKNGHISFGQGSLSVKRPSRGLAKCARSLLVSELILRYGCLTHACCFQSDSFQLHNHCDSFVTRADLFMSSHTYSTKQ